MRFFLALALLLLLIQPLGDASTDGIAENTIDPIDELRKKSKEDLKPKLDLVTMLAAEEKRKFDAANETLGKKVSEADRLNTDYETKKQVWESLQDAENELKEAKDEYKKQNKLLAKADNDIINIPKRKTELDEATREMDNFEQKFDPTPQKEAALVDARDDWASLKESSNNSIGTYTNAIGVQCTNAIDDLNCKGLREKLHDNKVNFAKATRELPIAQTALDEYFTNSVGYGSKYNVFKDKVDRLQKGVNTMNEDLVTANDEKTRLDPIVTRLKERVRLATVARDEKDSAAPLAEHQFDLAKKKKDAADKAVETQKKIVKEKQEQYDGVQRQVEDIKTVMAEKQQSGQRQPDTAGGFPKWAIGVIVVVVLLVIGGTIFGVFWKKGSKPYKEIDQMDFKTGLQGGIVSISRENSISDDCAEGVEYFPHKLPRNTPEPLKNHIAMKAVPGTPVTYSKPTVGKSAQLHYTCICNQDSIIDWEGNDQCTTDACKIIYDGPAKMFREIPNHLHVNDYENVPLSTDKIREMKVNTKTGLRAITGGKGVDAVIEAKQPSTGKNDESGKSGKSGKSETRVTNGGTSAAGTTAAGTTAADDERAMRKAREAMDLPLKDFKKNIGVYLSALTAYTFTGNQALFPFTYEFIMKVCKEVKPILAAEPQLIKTSHPVVITGDLHGRYDELHRHCSHYADGDKPGYATNRMVYIGDYVDRGPQSLEVIMFLFLLKILNPNSIILIRGNHETTEINTVNGFLDELKARLPDHAVKVHRTFNDVFGYMSLNCLISGSFLCMHGGITEEIAENIYSIEDHKKPCFPLKDPEVYGVVWNDPAKALKGFRKAPGRGNFYGVDMVAKLLRQGILAVVRGHQMMLNGIKYVFGHALISIFSCPAETTVGYKNITASYYINKQAESEHRYVKQGHRIDERQQSEDFEIKQQIKQSNDYDQEIKTVSTAVSNTSVNQDATVVGPDADETTFTTGNAAETVAAVGQDPRATPLKKEEPKKAEKKESKKDEKKVSKK